VRSTRTSVRRYLPRAIADAVCAAHDLLARVDDRDVAGPVLLRYIALHHGVDIALEGLAVFLWRRGSRRGSGRQAQHQ